MIWGFIYLLVMIGVWVGVIAYTFREGLWSLLLTSFNLFFATFMAYNYFEPLASLLVSMWRGIYWFAPGLCYWALLGTCLGIGQLATDALSKVKLKFHLPIEIIGRIVLSLSLATNTVYIVQSGFLVSNLPRFVCTNAGNVPTLTALFIVSGLLHQVAVPTYFAGTALSRMPVDTTSQQIIHLAPKYYEFRSAYALVDGMMAR